VKLAGSPIAPGLGMGTVSVVADVLDYAPPSPPGVARDVDVEWIRIEAAFAATREDLAEAVARLEREVGSGIADEGLTLAVADAHKKHPGRGGTKCRHRVSV
jgi:PEP-utilising enzyme, N-terminal